MFSSHIVSQLWVLSAAGIAASQLALTVLVFSSSFLPRFGDQAWNSFMREAGTGLVIFLFSSYVFICSYLTVLCCFLLSIRKKPTSSQYHFQCFLLCQSSFLCSMWVVWAICSPICWSFSLSGNFCLPSATYLQLHPSLVVMLLTYLCNVLVDGILLCLECWKILIFWF